MGEAHVRVAIVSKDQADLLVHRVGSWALARGGARWFFSRDKQDAEVWIYWCSIGMAQLRVCFVDLDSESGWVHPGHRLAGMFG